MIQIKTFYFNDLRECTYLLWDQTKECVIVDPGCYSANEKERLEKFITEEGLKPVMLLNTHG
ncbi:MAG: MBL fold metallo-hydrolase, partial [Bacteroidales bacterium]|nr:MBL fold metallo-hydrolase [Bacteroidales bacterium]